MGSVISTTTAASASFLGLPKTFVLVMVGLDDAGKTSLVSRLKRRELPRGVLPTTITTIGCTIETIPYGRHSVTIWEFGGMERVRCLWRRYFWHAHAFIFLLDAAAPARFPEAKEELLRLLDGIHYSYPVLVLANKIDLPSAVELRTIEDALSVPELVRGGKIALKGVSAMTGEGINEAIEWFVANISHDSIAKINEGKKHVIQAW
ncbi:ADP-ribosylation factor family-domain-containing protein [Mycena olivaceomarginata]|nr:ADP-ribosylation factor family-domain-containing protein [Mycena olivaceomarginata]